MNELGPESSRAESGTLALSASRLAGDEDELAARLYAYFATLEALDRRLGGFRFEDAGAREVVAMVGVAACARALAAGTTHWVAKRERRSVRTPRFWIGSTRAPEAVLELSAGVGEPPLAGVYLPERLSLRYRLRAPEVALAERERVPLLENALRAAVGLFEPDFAHAGPERGARARELAAEGAPCVSALTYLSAAYPRLERALEPPAKSAQIAHFGTLYRAHPEPSREGDAERAAVTRLGAALRAGALLVAPPRLTR